MSSAMAEVDSRDLGKTVLESGSTGAFISCCNQGHLTVLGSTFLCLVSSLDALVKHMYHWDSDLFSHPAAEFSLYFVSLCVCRFHSMHLETSF